MLHCDTHRGLTDLVQGSIEKPPPPKPRQRKRKEIDVVDDKTLRLQKRMVGIANGHSLLHRSVVCMTSALHIRPSLALAEMHGACPGWRHICLGCSIMVLCSQCAPSELLLPAWRLSVPAEGRWH